MTERTIFNPTLLIILAAVISVFVLTSCIGPGSISEIKTKRAGYFPEVSGIDLEGQQKTLPQLWSEPKQWVAIGFERWHQKSIDTWVPSLIECKNKHGIPFFEIPVIGKMNILGRTWLNQAMRMGITDTYLRSHTITVYTDVKTFATLLGLNRQKSYLLFVDNKGKVLWKHEGSMDAKGKKILAQYCSK